MATSFYLEEQSKCERPGRVTVYKILINKVYYYLKWFEESEKIDGNAIITETQHHYIQW